MSSGCLLSYIRTFCVCDPTDRPTPLVPQPVTYGSEIILMDTHSGISTAPLVIRKVDKGKIVSDDGGPVSQMQKIALQRINQDGTRHYLSAAGPMPGSAGTMSPAPGQAGSHPLIFQSPRVREDLKDGIRTVTDEVDDYLCWTIVGICEWCTICYFTVSHVDSQPNFNTPFSTRSGQATPFPSCQSRHSPLSLRLQSIAQLTMPLN
jgi:recombining binding protein (suppressor of hairless)